MSKWCECLKREVETCDCPAALPSPAGEVGELVERLRERAGFAREEKNATAICDARHFEEAADALQSLSARLAETNAHWEKVFDFSEDQLQSVNKDRLAAYDQLASANARAEKAERYAEGLAVALAARHYPEADMWRPLSGDLFGLLTQIDNMTTGLSRTAPAPAGGEDGWRHKKRGTTYDVIGDAELQTSECLPEGSTPLVVYRCRETGELWARPVDEFHDGRFERISPASPAKGARDE